MLERSIIRVKGISQKYKNQEKLQELRSNQDLIDKKTNNDGKNSSVKYSIFRSVLSYKKVKDVILTLRWIIF
jgi:hypothetical protein